MLTFSKIRSEVLSKVESLDNVDSAIEKLKAQERIDYYAVLEVAESIIDNQTRATFVDCMLQAIDDHHVS